jgi:hypothetical protein
MKTLRPLIIDGGRSVEQGNFHNPAEVAQSIPMYGKRPKVEHKVSITKDGVFDPILLVLRGNKRDMVGKEKYKVYPTSASEANYPQFVRRTKR